MTAPVFVDTNVLVYCFDTANPAKLQAAREWRAALWKNRFGRISFQILQELYWTGTQKWPLLRKEIQAEIRDLLEWHPVVINSDILEHSWEVQTRYKISFWDSLIVSAAKAASCRYLLTEDLQEGQKMDGVLVVNPFRSSPHEIPVEG
jgi:predicted nucleic acid-binding protein